MEISPFLVVSLNNAMNDFKAEKATDRWLKQNGITAKHFATTDTLLLQAQRTAHNTLKKHSRLLDTDQVSTLKAYLKAMTHQRTQASITTTQAYRVLNIGSTIRRQVFRHHRQFR